MKKLIAALAFAAAAALPAAAGTIENSFGNTLNVTLADGTTLAFHFNPDNTYVMKLPDNSTVSGSWALQNNQLCLTPAGGAPDCHPDPGNYNVGDTWTGVNGQGQEMSLSLTAGR